MIFLKNFKFLSIFSTAVIGFAIGMATGATFAPMSVPAFADSSTQGWTPSVSDSTKKIDPSDSSEKSLRAVEDKYSKAKSVTMSVTKTTENKLLKKKKSVKGKLVLKTPGRFRMDLDAPDKSAVILDGKKLWVVQYPQDPDFDNVTRVTVSSNPKKMQTPVLSTFLLGKGSLLDEFKITKHSGVANDEDLELSPKKSSDQVKRLVVGLDEKKKLITRITMTDQIDNVTEFDFSDVVFDSDVADKKFEYKAPADAEVNEM